ncbi:hypothetical protein FOCC_FOCC003682 [Frankliniella occidentalis]|uniref:Uncharacterized protein LOC113205055 isoform X1 n=1 Tax=Frankliniella occidentalis TaxID=133901 RepID=A0A6J1S6K7_FRAOC|nr:uncharacterized protein LOC113205055 isoform X1 [Frankliniella occidentalis]KAE8749695.1 hypothetical protein FOCC_FOCC003682 [Frankliniella occidentalis]
MEIEEDKCLINSLPDELLAFCLQNVDAYHLLHEVPRVCTRWNKLARDRLVWKKTGIYFDGSRKNDNSYVGSFIKLLNEVPYLGVLDISEVAVRVIDVASHDEFEPRLTHVTETLNSDSGANFCRNIGLSSLHSSAYFEGLCELLLSNQNTLTCVKLHDVQLGHPLEWADYGMFYELEKMKSTLSGVMEAVKNLPKLKELTLVFCEVWEYGAFKQWYEEMDRIVYTAVLQIFSLKRLRLVHARPLIESVPSPPPHSFWQLSSLEIVGESYFSDKLAAQFVSAARGTLRVFKSGHERVPRTMKVLGQCENLQVLDLPGLENNIYLKDLKKLHSLKIFSLRENYNVNVNAQCILKLNFLKNLRRLALIVVGDPHEADIILTIISQCQQLRTFILSEYQFPLRPRPFIHLAPKVVKSIVDGALPELHTFDVRSGADKEEWKEPLSVLKEHRPSLNILTEPVYLRLRS